LKREKWKMPCGNETETRFSVSESFSEREKRSWEEFPENFSKIKFQVVFSTWNLKFLVFLIFTWILVGSKSTQMIIKRGLMIYLEIWIYEPSHNTPTISTSEWRFKCESHDCFSNKMHFTTFSWTVNKKRREDFI
jgi:hypothetical protein